MKELEQIKSNILEAAKKKIVIAEKDFNQGIQDCKNGIYDKFYRYNHDDDGAAYDAGWMVQNKITQNERVTFIGQ